MGDGESTATQYGPFKWVALGLAVLGSAVALVSGTRGWIGGALGYTLVIGLVCSVPLGRLLNPHARAVQLVGGLLLIVLSVLTLRSDSVENPAQGIFIALMGVLILVQGLFPALRTWSFKGRPTGRKNP